MLECGQCQTSTCRFPLRCAVLCWNDPKSIGVLLLAQQYKPNSTSRGATSSTYKAKPMATQSAMTEITILLNKAKARQQNLRDNANKLRIQAKEYTDQAHGMADVIDNLEALLTRMEPSGQQLDVSRGSYVEDPPRGVDPEGVGQYRS